jgi:SPP1 family predicted phage head-tail adaptor
VTAQVTGPGDLNRRLTLLEPVENADDEGGVVRTFQALTTLWAQVLSLSAGADVNAGSLGAALRYRIVIRYRDDVTTRHQLQDGAHLYRVIAARASADRRFLVIEAEERED